VVTMEPMAPFQAGGRRFTRRDSTRLARRHLRRMASIAQWLPFHLVPQRGARSIVAAFLSVFPAPSSGSSPTTPASCSVRPPRRADRRSGRARPRRRARSPAHHSPRSARRNGPPAVRAGAPRHRRNQALAYGRLPADLMTGRRALAEPRRIQQLFSPVGRSPRGCTCGAPGRRSLNAW
jgi:hypothetical protein